MYSETASNILTILSCHQSNPNTLLQVLNISLVPQVRLMGGANDGQSRSKIKSYKICKTDKMLHSDLQDKICNVTAEEMKILSN